MGPTSFRGVSLRQGRHLSVCWMLLAWPHLREIPDFLLHSIGRHGAFEDEDAIWPHTDIGAATAMLKAIIEDRNEIIGLTTHTRRCHHERDHCLRPAAHLCELARISRRSSDAPSTLPRTRCASATMQSAWRGYRSPATSPTTRVQEKQRRHDMNRDAPCNCPSWARTRTLLIQRGPVSTPNSGKLPPNREAVTSAAGAPRQECRRMPAISDPPSDSHCGRSAFAPCRAGFVVTSPPGSAARPRCTMMRRRRFRVSG